MPAIHCTPSSYQRRALYIDPSIDERLKSDFRKKRQELTPSRPVWRDLLKREMGAMHQTNPETKTQKPPRRGKSSRLGRRM
jgi:hypothetical protein